MAAGASGMVKRFAPLFLFVVLLAALTWRLGHPGTTSVYSQMVNRDIPALSLPSLRAGEPPLTSAAFATGKPHLVNLFASWCVPCVAEAPLLMQLKQEGFPITGIAVRDSPEAVSAFLARHGDPFVMVGLDRDSRGQIALGSSGVPETFVVDRRGVIRRQFIGGLDKKSLGDVRQALVEAER